MSQPAGEMLLADVAPPPRDETLGTEAPPPPPHEQLIGTVGLVAIAIAVFAIVFVGLKMRTNAKKH